MKLSVFQCKWLIVMGLLTLVASCANVPEVAVPAETINTGSLEQTIAVLHRVEGLGAEAIAPKSHKKTRQALSEINAVIKRDPDNEQAIHNAVEHFTFEVEHLVHIIDETTKLREVNYQAMENVILSAEYRLLAISDALKQSDPRRQSLYYQTVTIANFAKRLATPTAQISANTTRHINKNELDDAQEKIQQLQLQLKDSQDKNVQLKRDQQPLIARIDSLERLTVNLNDKNTELEKTISELKTKLNKPKS